MLAKDQSKTRTELPGASQGFPPDVIVSSDTKRGQRIPPGQSQTLKWPVLDAFGAPDINLEHWTLRLDGLVRHPLQWNWREFLDLPRVQVFSDFHCVTRWSRLGNLWEGVAVKTILELAGGLLPEAAYALAHGYDSGWTTNLPLADLLVDDSLVAVWHDGQPVTAEHGGPARLIVPRLYAWKSAKWIARLEFLAQDKAGFWERNGYHMHGDPWKEERFGW